MSDAAIKDLASKALLQVDRQAPEQKQPVDKQLARILKDLEAIVKELNRAPAVGLNPDWKNQDILSRVRSVVNRVPGVGGTTGGDVVLGGDKGLPPDTKTGNKPTPSNAKDLFDPNA